MNRDTEEGRGRSRNQRGPEAASEMRRSPAPRRLGEGQAEAPAGLPFLQSLALQFPTTAAGPDLLPCPQVPRLKLELPSPQVCNLPPAKLHTHTHTHTHAQSAGPYPSPRPPCRPRLTPTTPRKWTADPKSEHAKKTPRGKGLDDHGWTSPQSLREGRQVPTGWSHRGRKPLRLIPFDSSQQGLAAGRQPDQATVGPEEWGDGVGRPR